MAAAGLVLIVEDDQAILETLGEVLRQEGYCTLKANDLPKAYGILNGMIPDAILLDYLLKDTTAAPLVGHLARMGLRDKTALMTAMSKPESIAKQLQLSYYIEKPFDADYLLRTVNTLCRKSRQEPEVA